MTTQKKILIMALLLSLSACTTVKKELGVDRNSPDEFMVVKQAPLTMPPDYTLRPPQDQHDAAPAAIADSAREALMGKSQDPAVKGSAETALLDKLGASSSNPDIRKQIDEENGYISLTNRTVAEKLIFWDDEQPSIDNTPSSVIDPKAEAARIKENQTKDAPLTGQGAPVIEHKKNTLENIF